MGKVQAHITVHAPRELVYDVAQDVERYHEFLPSVKSVKVQEQHDDGRRKSKWDAVAEVAGFKKPVRWLSTDHWQHEHYKAEFRQLQGDYKKYGGQWRFTEIDANTTRMDLEVDFELKGVPGIIKPVIDPLLDILMTENCKSMLSHMKKRAEGLNKQG